jgi:hypothetical protein
VHPRSQQVMAAASSEAARLGHRYLGPEHVLLGILRAGGSRAAQLLEANGVELDAARAVLGRLIAEGVLPGPRPGDAELLGALGIDLDEVRRHLDHTFGPRAVDHATREATRARRRGMGRVPRTPLQDPPVFAARVLQLAGEQARTLRYDEVTPELLLLGLVLDVTTRPPRCMSNPWARQLRVSVGLPGDYHGVTGLLLARLGADPQRLRDILTAELRAAVP